MPRIATFTVSLSKPSSNTITVDYTTQNGVPVGGDDWEGATGGVSLDPADYISASGILSFAPGELTKTVTVQVREDLPEQVEERFKVVLSNPVNATLASKSQGIAIMPGSGPLLLLTISAGVIELELASPTLLRLSTSGNQIVDSNGQTVRLRSVNWYGFESSDGFPQSWGEHWKKTIDRMSAVGFNCIRLPLSGDILTQTPRSDVGLVNTDIVGLTSLQALDAIIEYGATKGMRFVLDHHRAVAGSQGSDAWNGSYDSQTETNYTKAQWISFWTTLATRYQNEPAVCGADIHNEPHMFTWASWKTYAQDCANAIHGILPHWLIFVEGIGEDQFGTDWWGGGLGWVATDPVVLVTPNKLVYSPHDYAYSVFNQSWLPTTTNIVEGFPTSLKDHWTPHWGFIFEQGIAPIWLGEFGGSFGRDGDGNLDATQPNAENEKLWLASLIAYLNGDMGLSGGSVVSGEQKGMSFAYWAWNPGGVHEEYPPLFGLVQNDFRTINQHTMILLQPLLVS